MKKYQQAIPLKPGEKVFIKAHATLDIEGWGKNEVSIETDLNVQRIRREDEGLFLMFVDDAAIKVPKQTEVVVQKASGNARLRKVIGSVEINSVSGNLAVQHAGKVKINRVSGGCLIQDIAGDLDIRSIGGSLKGKDFRGVVVADRISAGVELLGLQAGAEIRAMGDIRVSFLSESLEPIKLRSSASIYINLPFGLDAEMKVKSNAHLTELVIGERQEKIHHRKHVLLVGEGRRKFELESGGKVRIVAEQIEDTEILNLFEELETLWAELQKQNIARREAHNGISIMADSIGEAAMDDGVDISMEEMKAAEERVQFALNQVENRLQSLGYDSGSVMETNTDQDDIIDITGERLIIMRLLEDNKISIDDADKLLEALEHHKP